MAHDNRQYAQMLQACKALSGAVKAAETFSPIPDAAMQKMYVKSLASFKSGAAECMADITQSQDGPEDVVTHVDSSGLQQAISHLSLGVTDLYIATNVLRG